MSKNIEMQNKNFLQSVEKQNTKLTVGGLFAGIGGIELGFAKAGFKISWANEVDKNACITYRKNHNF